MPNKAPCDSCLVRNLSCPGQLVHCLEGNHCIDTTEVCALDFSHNDHPNKCEDCGKKLYLIMPDYKKRIVWATIILGCLAVWAAAIWVTVRVAKS